MKVMENVELIWSLIEGTNDLVQNLRSDNSFEFVNRAWLETLKYTDEEAEQLYLQDIVFPGYQKAHKDAVSRVFEGETITNIESIFLTKDGDQVFVEGNLFPRRESGKVVAAQGFYRDITERKQVEEKLRDERAHAEVLVDLMVHDLTNINQELMSLLELLLHDPSISPQLEGLIREGFTEVERGAGLIANVRKISRIHALKSQMTHRDLAEGVHSAAEAVKAEFPERELHLKTSISPGQYLVVVDVFLTDIFESLFHNSMKFDKRKQVEVEVEVEAIQHSPFLKIQIKDRGPGIPDAEKEKIFDQLVRRRESLMGLGLSLTLVKQIVQTYGGYIRVEDRVEGDYTKGANFVILLHGEEKGVSGEEEAEED